MHLSEDDLNRIWSKGVMDPTHNHDEWRKDPCGAWIKRSEYGNPVSPYGWVASNERGEHQSWVQDPAKDLRPVHCENWCEFAALRCSLTSLGSQNVPINRMVLDSLVRF